MASREILSLDTATPQIVAPQTGDTYSAPRAVAISPESLTGTSATTSLNIAQTWNTTGTPTAILLNVTDTASNAASKLLDLGTGGGTFSSKFSVRKDGRIFGDADSALTLSGGFLNFYSYGSVGFSMGSAGLTLGIVGGTTGSISIQGASASATITADAADTLALRRTTNAQTFRVYNTYTDASNYERGFIRYVSNQLEIGHEAAGTGNGDRLIVIQRPNAGTVLDIKGSTTVAARIGTAVSGFGVAIGVGSNGTNPDVFVYRRATAIASLTGNATGTTGAALEFIEQTAPAAPATNGVRIYAEDNGAGKTRLMALFATGAAQQIAIEP